MLQLAPDSLVRFLESHSCGVACTFVCPTLWAGRQWIGDGTLEMALVQSLAECLAHDGPLPDQMALSVSSDLEASALRAMDLVAAYRYTRLLHADDPVLFASSSGELRRTLDLLPMWSSLHNSFFHASSRKTVVFKIGPVGVQVPLLLLAGRSMSEPVRLCLPPVHRWIGLMWDASFGEHATLHKRIQISRRIFFTLAGHIASGSLPLPISLQLFETKVDGALAQQQWLYIIAADPESMLNATFADWSRSLLWLPHWRSSTAARFELGWQLSGMPRAIRDLVCRGAKLLSLPDDDFYHIVFIKTHNIPNSLPARVLALASAWGTVDFSAATFSTYAAYRRAVALLLRARCVSLAAAHISSKSLPLPGSMILSNKVCAFHLVHSQAASWDTHFGMRAWSRSRVGAIILTHKAGRQSQARLQHCVFCDQLVEQSYLHVWIYCAVWTMHRTAVLQLLPACPAVACERMVTIIGLMPGDAGFEESVAFSSAVDTQASVFWRNVAPMVLYD